MKGQRIWIREEATEAQARGMSIGEYWDMLDDCVNTESDPTGRLMSDPGAKADSGKLRYTLIPPSSLKWLAKLWTRGAEKYSPDGWKKVPEGEERYMDALFRHLEKCRAGEWMDEDTGVPHLINVAWNALVIVWLHEHK